MKIRTLDVSLYMDWAEGKISLREAACEFCLAGWTNFVDVDATMNFFRRVKTEKQDQLW